MGATRLMWLLGAALLMGPTVTGGELRSELGVAGRAQELARAGTERLVLELEKVTDALAEEASAHLESSRHQADRMLDRTPTILEQLEVQVGAIDVPDTGSLRERLGETLGLRIQSLALDPEPQRGPTSPERAVEPPSDLAATTLLIPRISVAAPIVEVRPGEGTWDLDPLTQEVAYLWPTAQPGVPGNAVLAGHVTLARGGDGPFRWLSSLRAGDVVEIASADRVFRYQVTGSKVVEPTDLSVLEQTSHPTLTLITCIGWDPSSWEYSNRLIVTGELVSAGTPDPISSLTGSGALRQVRP